jgi:glycosyltransferase involved in cell wall biosynthesis
MTPIVSIILPCYNGASRVTQSIESVLTQTFTDWELIIIDDGSTDDTWKVVSAYEGPQVHCIRLPENRGVEFGRATALNLARGEFIALLDDDDPWLPEKLSLQVAYMRAHPDCGLLHGGIVDVYPDGRRLPRMPARGSTSYRTMLVRDVTIASTILARKDAIEDVGGFAKSMRSSGDWDLFTRIGAKYRVGAIDQQLATGYPHSGSITHDKPEVLARNRLAVVRRNWPELKRLGLRRDALAHHDCYVAGLLLVAGRRREARRRVLRSLRLRSLPRALPVLVLSFMGAKQVERGWAGLQRLRRALRL